MGTLLIILATLGIGVGATRFFPTEEMLQDRFAMGQNYYAANDHENSVRVFEQIEKIPNYALLDVDRIEVSIGELTLPMRLAATYQLGNSYRNVGLTKLERSLNAAADGDSLIAVERHEEGIAAFSAAKEYYRRLVADQRTLLQMRVMSQYQIVRANFQMKNYPGVVEETENLLELFPGNEYAEAALYDRGWAYYHMEEYSASIGAFAQMLERGTDPLKIDRAIFQTAESHFALAHYELARQHYQSLVTKYDFSAMSARDLQAMKTAQIRGLVQETTRELVAKAQIRSGDAYAAEADIDRAISAYSLVPERFPQESLLVQKSFDNMASMLLEDQGADAGIGVLRRAIDQVADPLFRGRAQLKIARVLFGQGRYAEAVDEYKVYVKAYGDQALAIGFTLDRVLFMLGEAERELARQALAAGQEGRQHYQLAAEHYRSLLDKYPASVRAAEAQYGLGHTYFGLGEIDRARTHFTQTAEQYARAMVAPFALSWQGRTELLGGDEAAALASYRRLLEHYPQAQLVDQTWKDLGLVYKRMGRADEAIDAFDRVAPTSPLWIRVQAEIGDMLLAAGRLDEIDTRLDLAEAARLAVVAGDGETLAELHYIQGRIAREKGEKEDEIAHFSAVLQHSANVQLNTYARFFRGLAYYQAGTAADALGDSSLGAAHFREAVEDLEILLGSNVAEEIRPIAYRTRGVALTRLGRSAEAVNAYEELIEAAVSDEERSDFALMRMELYYDQEQIEHTERAAWALIGANFVDDNDRGFYKKERAYLVLVSLFLEQERYAEALKTAREALQRYPQSAEQPTLLLASGRSLFAMEEFAAAAQEFGRLIGAHPTHPDLPAAYYQQGFCYEILGEYEQAAAAFGALGRNYPADPLAPDALYRAGENLYNGSRFEEALTYYLDLDTGYAQSAFAPQALYSASWTYMDLEQEEASITTMQRLAQRYPASEYARYAQFSIGDYYYSKKQYEPALAAYQAVVDRYDGTTEADKAKGLVAELEEDMASRDYEVVIVAFESKRYPEAVEGFEAIFKKYPRSYSALAALANKGVALEKLGADKDARQTYERVLELAVDEKSGDIVKFVKLRLEHL